MSRHRVLARYVFTADAPDFGLAKPPEYAGSGRTCPVIKKAAIRWDHTRLPDHKALKYPRLPDERTPKSRSRGHQITQRGQRIRFLANTRDPRSLINTNTQVSLLTDGAYPFAKPTRFPDTIHPVSFAHINTNPFEEAVPRPGWATWKHRTRVYSACLEKCRKCWSYEAVVHHDAPWCTALHRAFTVQRGAPQPRCGANSCEKSVDCPRGRDASRVHRGKPFFSQGLNTRCGRRSR